jgi:hypothetical protein
MADGTAPVLRRTPPTQSSGPVLRRTDPTVAAGPGVAVPAQPAVPNVPPPDGPPGGFAAFPNSPEGLDYGHFDKIYTSVVREFDSKGTVVRTTRQTGARG